MSTETIHKCDRCPANYPDNLKSKLITVKIEINTKDRFKFSHCTNTNYTIDLCYSCAIRLGIDPTKKIVKKPIEAPSELTIDDRIFNLIEDILFDKGIE